MLQGVLLLTPRGVTYKCRNGSCFGALCRGMLSGERGKGGGAPLNPNNDDIGVRQDVINWGGTLSSAQMGDLCPSHTAGLFFPLQHTAMKEKLKNGIGELMVEKVQSWELQETSPWQHEVLLVGNYLYFIESWNGAGWKGP